MSWFCDAGGGGTAGIAFLGTLCSTRGWNTNLNERQWSAAGTGFVSLTHQKIISIPKQTEFILNHRHVFRSRFLLMSLGTTLECITTLMRSMAEVLAPATDKV